MLDSSLLDMIQANWNNWSQSSISVEPVQEREYIILTNRVNGLNRGIAFYLHINEDGTYTLTDRILTANSIEKEIGSGRFSNRIHEIADLAAQYGVLIDNRGEFINQGIGQLGLVDAIDNFAELLYRVIDYSENPLNR